MNLFTDKKSIRLLRHRDMAALDDLFERYADSVYTYAFYAAGSAPQAAADIVEQTFIKAVKSIETFDPAASSICAWLVGISKELTRKPQQTGLEFTGQQSIPEVADENILQSWKNFSSEAMPEQALQSPLTARLVHLTLLDIPMQFGFVLKEYYYNLKQPTEIALSLKTRESVVMTMLFRARHAFSEAFIRLSSAESGQAVSSLPGMISNRAYLETNIERIFHAVEPELKLPPDKKEQIKERLAQEIKASETAAADSSALSLFANKRFLKASVVIVILLAALAAMVFFLKSPGPIAGGKQPQPVPVPVQTAGLPDNDRNLSDKSSSYMARLQEEEKIALKKISDLASVGDINGLLEVLSKGKFSHQLAAAQYLLKIGDDRAVQPLLDLSFQWYDNQPDNPFAFAARQIQQRLNVQKAVSGQADDKSLSTHNQPSDMGTSETKQTSMPDKTAVVIEGYIFDNAGRPRANEAVYCGKAVAFTVPGEKTPQYTKAAVTGPDGFYRIENLTPVLTFLRTENGSDVSSGVAQRAVIPHAGKTTTVNFGGKAVLGGQVDIDLQPLAGTRLLLSESVDVELSAFVCYSVTDKDGNYLFTGVPAGVYQIFFESPQAQNTWFKLAEIKTGTKDLMDCNISTVYADVVLSLAADYTDFTPDIFDVRLEQGTDFLSRTVGTVIRTGEPNEPYRIMGLLPGSYTAVVSMPGGVDMREKFVLPAAKPEHRVTVRLPDATASVVGRLAGSASAKLVLSDSDRKIIARINPLAGTFYIVSPLPAGEYGIGVMIADDILPLVQFRLDRDENKTIDLDLSALFKTDKKAVIVHVVDVNGAPIVGAGVWTEGSKGTAKLTAGWGAMFFTDLGRIVINAEFEGRKQAAKTLNIPKGPADITTSSPTEAVIILEQ